MHRSFDDAQSQATGSATTGRSLRLLPAQSPEWVIVQVMRDAQGPEWTPASAADRLVDRIPDPRVLRHARAHLRTIAGRRVTIHRLRAVATLNLAIHRLEHDSTPVGPATVGPASTASPGPG
ncbi:hypothetical protein [Kribbella sp. NPDC004875]|uniref:hypothetical protein n=1 Tax=Kribbella sp. NPDC004875 TaxID=3364107 RepID=UPI0036876C70